MDYFASVGYSCPVYTNPSDFYLTIAKDSGALLAKKWAASAKIWNSEEWLLSDAWLTCMLPPSPER